jgi:hypothetical protein
MIPLRSTRTALVAAILLPGCHCGNTDIVDPDSDTSTTASTASTASEDALTTPSSTGTTGEPFDASRWLGRYHYENVFLPFGERGNPHGSYSLANFEILPDQTAAMFYDDCSYDEGVTTLYTWVPSDDDDWLELHPGPGETSLRFWADPDVETLRVQMIDPCRELRFEIDGRIEGLAPFRPGESCWIDRCVTPSIIHVDYCEGEEPPPCP